MLIVFKLISNRLIERTDPQTKALPISCIKKLWNMVFRLLGTLYECASVAITEQMQNKNGEGESCMVP